MPSTEVMCRLIRAIGIPADHIVYPDTIPSESVDAARFPDWSGQSASAIIGHVGQPEPCRKLFPMIKLQKTMSRFHTA